MRQHAKLWNLLPSSGAMWWRICPIRSAWTFHSTVTILKERELCSYKDYGWYYLCGREGMAWSNIQLYHHTLSNCSLWINLQITATSRLHTELPWHDRATCLLNGIKLNVILILNYIKYLLNCNNFTQCFIIKQILCYVFIVSSLKCTVYLTH